MIILLCFTSVYSHFQTCMIFTIYRIVSLLVNLVHLSQSASPHGNEGKVTREIGNESTLSHF